MRGKSTLVALLFVNRNDCSRQLRAAGVKSQKRCLFMSWPCKSLISFSQMLLLLPQGEQKPLCPVAQRWRISGPALCLTRTQRCRHLPPPCTDKLLANLLFADCLKRYGVPETQTPFYILFQRYLVSGFLRAIT